MKLRKRILIVAVTGSLVIASTVPSIALADPPEGGNAGCMGYEAADVSPPGSEDGTFSQHGMPGILEFTDLGVEALGLKNRGQVLSALAKLHSGSHEQCDDDFGVPPDVE